MTSEIIIIICIYGLIVFLIVYLFRLLRNWNNKLKQILENQKQEVEILKELLRNQSK